MDNGKVQIMNCVEISTSSDTLVFYMFTVKQMRHSELFNDVFGFEAFLEYEKPANAGCVYPEELKGLIVNKDGYLTPVLVLPGDVQERVLDAFTHKKRIMLHVTCNKFKDTPVIDAALPVENYVLGKCPDLSELSKKQHFGRLQDDARLNMGR